MPSPRAHPDLPAAPRPTLGAVVLRVVTRLWRSSPRHAALLLAAAFAGLVLVLSGATDSAASEGDHHDREGWSDEEPDRHRWSGEHGERHRIDTDDADAPDAADAAAPHRGEHDEAQRGDRGWTDSEHRGVDRHAADRPPPGERHHAPPVPAPPAEPVAPPSIEVERTAPEPAVAPTGAPEEQPAPSIDLTAAPAEEPTAEAPLPDTSPRPIAHPSLPDGGGEDGALHTTPVSNPAVAAVLFLHEGPLGAPIARLAVHEPALERPIFYVSNRVPG